MRAYVMLSAALEHERLLIAERLLSEIERRHGLPHPDKREIHPVITDGFLATYLPEAREGEPAPLALEYAFAPNLSDALRLLQEVVNESAQGRGAAMYIYDLDTGLAADTTQANSTRTGGRGERRALEGRARRSPRVVPETGHPLASSSVGESWRRPPMRMLA